MIFLSSRSISLFILVTIAWVVGASALLDVFKDFADQWWWLAIATFYVLFMNEHFLHGTLGHIWYKINPNRVFYKILVFLSSTSLTFGSVKGMLIMHETHHHYADQDKRDYLSLRKRWMTSGLVSPLMFVYEPYKLEIPNQAEFVKNKQQEHPELVNDGWTDFCDRHLVSLTIAWWTSLYLLAPEILFNLILMGRLLMSIYVFINTVVGHTDLLFGYRNFRTPDNSHNNLFFHCLFLGMFSTLLHNNHHGKDFSKDQSHQYKWWEFDTGFFVQKFLIKPWIEQR